MIDVILAFKWHILIISEVCGWVFTVLLIIARYYFESNLTFWVSIIMVAILDYIPSIALPLLDFIYTKDIGTWLTEGGLLFNLVVIILFILGLTLGKKYLKKLDRTIKYYVSKGKLKRNSMN